MLFRRNPCSTYTARMSDYLDGTLESSEVEVLQVHARSCDHCGAVIAELGLTVRLTRSVPPRAAPRSFKLEPAMVRTAREVPVERSPAARQPFWGSLTRRPELVMGYGGALASVALVAVLVTDLTRDSDSPVTPTSIAGLEASAPTGPAESADDQPAAAPATGEEAEAFDSAAELTPAAGEAGEAQSARAAQSDSDEGAATTQRRSGLEEGSTASVEGAAPALIVQTETRGSAWLAAEIALAAGALTAFLLWLVLSRRRQA
jgi:hypothetical protein